VRTFVSSVVLIALALAPSQAAAQTADKLFRGTTGQSKRVAVRVGAAQKVTRVTVAWIAPCRRGGTFENDTVVSPRARRSTVDVFEASGSYPVRQKGGYRMRVRMVIRGLRDVSSAGVERWTGTVRATVVIRRRGRVIERCRLRSTAWSATLPAAQAPRVPGAPAPAPPSPSPAPPQQPPPSGSRTPTVGAWSFDMTGDAGDYVTGGRRWVHGPPGDKLSVQGGGAVVNFSVQTSDGSWNVDFAAPQGQQLPAGTRYADARRYPFQDANPGLSVSGMGRGCNRLTGEFTVHEVSYDNRGVLTRFKASFVQHCEGGAPAARGTIEFSSP